MVVKVKGGYGIKSHTTGEIYPKVYPTAEAAQARIDRMEQFKHMKKSDDLNYVILEKARTPGAKDIRARKKRAPWKVIELGGKRYFLKRKSMDTLVTNDLQKAKGYIRVRRGKREQVKGYVSPARQAQLANVHDAIKEGRAFLDTAFGKYKVTAYNDDTGWAVSYPADKAPDWANKRSFMVTLDSIKIEPIPNLGVTPGPHFEVLQRLGFMNIGAGTISSDWLDPKTGIKVKVNKVGNFIVNRGQATFAGKGAPQLAKILEGIVPSVVKESEGEYGDTDVQERLVEHAKDTLTVPQSRLDLTGGEYFGMSKEHAREILSRGILFKVKYQKGSGKPKGMTVRAANSQHAEQLVSKHTQADKIISVKENVETTGVKEPEGEYRRITPEPTTKAETIYEELKSSNPPVYLAPQVKKKVNDELHSINSNYYDAIPLDSIFNALEKRGLIPLQEDNTRWSGILAGREAQIYIPIGATGSRSPEGEFEPMYKPLKNTQLNLSWFAMPSGKYEINTYLV